MGNRDFRLATLLAQASSGEISEDIKHQILTWERNDSLGYIDLKRLKIYQLLSGDVVSVCR